FFSSRRRHTRFSRDWSSDVCSSDLTKTTLARVFADNGYKTGFIGKWHMDGRGRNSYIPPTRRQGFEYWKALECTHNYNHSAYYRSEERRVGKECRSRW